MTLEEPAVVAVGDGHGNNQTHHSFPPLGSLRGEFLEGPRF